MPSSITATTTTPCPCCSLTNALQCRVRGGTATICGFSEKTSASTPPKKYRKNTVSQDMYWCTYNSTPCSGTAGRFRVAVNGDATYDPSTCVLTQITRSNYGSNTGPCEQPSNLVSTSSVSNLVFDPAFMVNSVLTQTQQDVGFLGGGVCYNFSGSNYVNAFGTATSTLSNEDTEADAIARFQAATSWGSWIASGGTGCTGTPPSCCLAKYESRTSGFSFGYGEAEARVTATGLTPSTGYTAKIELYRRPYGSGTFAHYQTATVTGTSDGSGNLTTSAATVTNTKGYETYAAASSLLTT